MTEKTINKHWLSKYAIDFIDTSFLYKPTPEKPGEKCNNEGWGYLDIHDHNVQSAFKEINKIVNPKKVIEIGMFAGHSTVMMLDFFDLEWLDSYDPNRVSAASAIEIKKRYNNFNFYNTQLWENEDRYLEHDAEEIDLVFVDGDHRYKSVIKDIYSCLLIEPRFILFDNIERSDVSDAINTAGFYNEIFQPQYFFYTNTHKGKVKPGILMLVNMEEDDDSINRIYSNLKI